MAARQQPFAVIVVTPTRVPLALTTPHGIRESEHNGFMAGNNRVVKGNTNQMAEIIRWTTTWVSDRSSQRRDCSITEA